MESLRLTTELSARDAAELLPDDFGYNGFYPRYVMEALFGVLSDMTTTRRTWEHDCDNPNGGRLIVRITVEGLSAN